MKPRIAIVIHSMIGGGAERFVSHLLDSLKSDFETHLLLFENIIEYPLPEGQIVEFIENDAEIRSNLFNILRLPIASRRLAKYCKQHEIQLVISFLNRPNFIACFAKYLGLKPPVLISERTFAPLWFKENDIRGKVAKFLISWLYPLADAILPNSQGTCRALKEHYGIRNNYFVIKNIVDLDRLDRTQLEEVDDVNFDTFTFAHVGSFSPMKGHELMVAAFARLNPDNAQLLFIGKGNLYDDIKDQVASLGLQDRILFLGHKSNPFKYLSRANCFVFASDFEGFPNVLIEALACGLPIISTDCQTGPRELLAPGTEYKHVMLEDLEQGEHGLLVPVRNEKVMCQAMKTIIENDELRINYELRSKSMAAQYDRKIVIEEFKQIIGKFL